MGVIEAVIFDMDGLMIDTERLAFRVFERIFAPYGITLSNEHFHAVMGLDADSTVDYFLAITGVPLDHEALSREHYRRMMVAMENELEPNPGLLELIAELQRRGIALGIASNSPVDYVIGALKTIRLEQAFRIVAGRDEVPLGKPAPDVYLLAARRLGYAPVACLAIEDSPVGMQAALAAGLRCAVVNEVWRNDIFSAADGRYPSLGALCEDLNRLLGEIG